MKRVAVFCGSKSGNNPIFSQAAEELGRLLVARNLGLVYGGNNRGLMGVLARTVAEAGGEVWGITPLNLYIEHTDFKATKTEVVSCMHERKSKMYSSCDGAIVMPGAYGTLEEGMEFLAWSQIGLHSKPCVILNIAQYFYYMLMQIDAMIKNEFLSPTHRELIKAAQTPAEAVELLGL